MKISHIQQIPIVPAAGQLPANLIVFSHLRWDFVYQRPQHLLTRLANHLQVVFIEEPVFDAVRSNFYKSDERQNNITVIVPHLQTDLSDHQKTDALKSLLKRYLSTQNITDYGFWYYTPMALEFSRAFEPSVTIYDCMDELAAFKFAPESLKTLEKELMAKADVVFTGGHSIYEAKKNSHGNIHPFPSGIDREHFAQARSVQKDDNIIRLGFFGVIDERLDIDLIQNIAEKRPEWQITLIGPVVKIDPATLPRRDNIHYLGQRSYNELPQEIALWDIALIPFLLNESTRFISPTKTPEYLAAGKPVISTPIRDVVNPYGIKKLVAIARDGDDFITAAEELISKRPTRQWLQSVDIHLAKCSWDRTAADMLKLITSSVAEKVNTKLATGS